VSSVVKKMPLPLPFSVILPFVVAVNIFSAVVIRRSL
jgi:hypothetical protein